MAKFPQPPVNVNENLESGRENARKQLRLESEILVPRMNEFNLGHAEIKTTATQTAPF